jgi:hypothetical protein
VSSDTRDTVVQTLQWQAGACAFLGSTFYETLLTLMAEDAATGGAAWRLFARFADAPRDDAYVLRVLGGIHFRVLRGHEPVLAARYPSTGGDSDATGAWERVAALLDTPPPELIDALGRPPQTNEVGRSASMLPGFLTVADEFGLPLRVLELGASAGLNLQFDAYRYEQGDAGFGPVASPVRFVDQWSDVAPPFDAPLTVAERRACDRDPIDVSESDGRLRLLSYLWPDVTERFERTHAALDLAAANPPPVDRADAAAWIAEQLPGPTPGHATVVFHSVVWPYLPSGTASQVRDIIEAAGAAATAAAPIAWLRLEPPESRGSANVPPSAYPELRLRVWPGGEDRHLADASFHTGPLRRPSP